MLKIYTKTGDKGQTSLYGGKRVDKDDVRVEAYGTVDELNSAIGVVIAEIKKQRSKIKNKEINIILQEIQSDLFSIGAMLAGDKRDLEARSLELEARTKRLEELIDWMAERLPQQKHFILPGGSSPSAHLHVTRSVCRRAERRVVSLCNLQLTTDNLQQILIYLNRLSDFLFTLAKWVNKKMEIDEVEWSSE